MIKINYLFAVVIFLLHLIPFMIAPHDFIWFEIINKPNFTPSYYINLLFWVITFIIISISASNTLLADNHDKRFYLLLLIINYVFIQTYPYIMFVLNDILLAFVNIILMLITSLMLKIIGSKINKRVNKYMYIVTLWLIFSAFLHCGFLHYNRMVRT